jgi:hypothetical protein
MVDLGGRRLHLMEAGQGPPTVVILPALSEGGLGWVRVQRELAGEMRVVLYDRAGTGWSDPLPRGRRLEIYGRAGGTFFRRLALRQQARILGLHRLAAAAGRARELDADIAEMFLPEHAAAGRAIALSTRYRRVVAGEFLMMARLCGQPPGLGAIPLTVVTAGHPRTPHGFPCRRSSPPCPRAAPTSPLREAGTTSSTTTRSWSSR